MTKILAIETSCDETAAAVITAKKEHISALSGVISSQIKLHQKTNGVVPEVAARAHIQKISGIVKRALKDAGIDLNEIDYIAVTAGPGLVPSLLVGVEYAKALAFATNKKMIPVNHMLGHLYSSFINNPKIKLPSINLIVSGGHTYLVYLKSRKEYKVIGQTVDDAAGEAFDKVAKMLKLPYPGGPQISKQALHGKNDLNFPRPMMHTKNYNFSFAGLKTSVMYTIRDGKLDIKDKQTKSDIAMSFENAAVDVLVAKTIKAALNYKAKSITLSGGVAANSKLRKDLNKAAKQVGINLYVPDMSLCTDNALMIANAAAIMLSNGYEPLNTERVKVNPVMGI